MPALAMAANPVVTLAPHRAVYDMVLDNTKESRGVVAVAGRMVFDFSGSECDGYTLNIRLVTRMTGQSGAATTTDLRSSTWEHGEGRQFRFNSTQYRDEAMAEIASGNALRDDGGADVMVDLTKPEPASRRYPGPILFPTQHSVAILSAAMKGKRIVQARIFDGSEKGQKLYDTTAFIGKRLPPGSKDKKSKPLIEEARSLAAFASWPVTISYFDNADKQTETPDYELSFRLYANGISRDILINYGTFAIRGRLSSLKVFERSDCN